MTGSSAEVSTLFLDANILISAAWKPNAEVTGIWRLEGVHLITSTYVMIEVRRNLPLPSQIERLQELLSSVKIIARTRAYSSETAPVELTQLPEKDHPVLAHAIESKAKFLITGDKKHFGQWFGLKIAGVTILPPTELLNQFRLGQH